MPNYVFLYSALVFLSGSLFILIIFIFGNKLFNVTYWWKAGKGVPRKGMRYEIFNLLVMQSILLGCFRPFSTSIISFKQEIIPNLFFIGGLIIGIVLVFHHNLHVLPIQDEKKLEKTSCFYQRHIKKGFWRKWIFTYFFYGLYSVCFWIFTIYIGAVFLIYHLVTSVSHINNLGRSIRQQIAHLSTVSDSEIYVGMLQVIRDKYAILSKQIGELTINYTFFLGLITLFSIIVTCTPIQEIWSEAGKKWIRWAFFLIVIFLGPTTLLLGTHYYEFHFERVFPIIERVVDNNLAKGTSVVFPLEALREYFWSNFRPKAFFTDNIVSLKAFSIWLFPILSIIISRFLQSTSFSDYIDNLLPKKIAEVIKKILEFLSSFGPPSDKESK